MAAPPQETWQQQFKRTNYIGLAMMGAVVIYALLVLAIDKGYLPYRAPLSRSSTADTLRFIFLGLAVLDYFVIWYFQKFSRRAAQYLPPGAVIIFALCEAVSLLGLVLFLLNGNATDFFSFMVISLLYFYLFYPKYGDWEKLSNQQFSKDSPG